MLAGDCCSLRVTPLDTKVVNNAQHEGYSTATPYPDGARRVTIEELEALMKEGKAFVVDVRIQDAYDAGHIPGSKLIPAGEIAEPHERTAARQDDRHLLFLNGRTYVRPCGGRLKKKESKTQQLCWVGSIFGSRKRQASQ